MFNFYFAGAGQYASAVLSDNSVCYIVRFSGGDMYAEIWRVASDKNTLAELLTSNYL